MHVSSSVCFSHYEGCVVIPDSYHNLYFLMTDDIERILTGLWVMWLPLFIK